jgi:hypothetical protein
MSVENRRKTVNHLVTVAEAIPTTENPEARDWSAFLAALLAFAKEVLPLITPLFSETDPTTK